MERHVVRTILFICLMALTLSVGAQGQNITWRASDSPRTISGTYAIPQGTTVTVEPGVVINIRADSKLVVEGQFLGQGTAANPIRIVGANNYSSELVVNG